jgi:hypothetical protein
MDINEARLWAKDYAVRQLVRGGTEFRGLGSLAILLVQQVSTPAHELAKTISPNTTRTSDAWLAMKDEVVGMFVQEVLGFESRQLTLTQACDALVVRVYEAYVGWAEEAKANPAKADAAAVRG